MKNPNYPMHFAVDLVINICNNIPDYKLNHKQLTKILTYLQYNLNPFFVENIDVTLDDDNLDIQIENLTEAYRYSEEIIGRDLTEAEAAYVTPDLDEIEKYLNECKDMTDDEFIDWLQSLDAQVEE